MEYMNLLNALLELQDEAYKLGQEMPKTGGGVPTSVEPELYDRVNNVTQMAYDLADKIRRGNQ